MYKNFIALLFTFLFLTSLNANAQDNDPNMGIIPAPVSVKRASGEFTLSQQTTLFADSANNKAVSFFTDYLQHKLMLRNELKVNSNQSLANSIVFTDSGTENLPEQGYRL